MEAFLLKRRLDLRDLDRVRAFRAFGDFKAQRVAFAERIEGNSDELVGVEKEVFFAAFNFDEPETFVSETGDCSCLHSNWKKWLNQLQCAGGKVDP